VTNKPTPDVGLVDEVYYSGPDVGLQVQVLLPGGSSIVLPQIPWAPIMVSWLGFINTKIVNPKP
jgi:hypothetical protein